MLWPFLTVLLCIEIYRKADCPVKSFDSKSKINYWKPYPKSNDLIKRGQGGN